MYAAAASGCLCGLGQRVPRLRVKLSAHRFACAGMLRFQGRALDTRVHTSDACCTSALSLLQIVHDGEKRKKAGSLRPRYREWLHETVIPRLRSLTVVVPHAIFVGVHNTYAGDFGPFVTFHGGTPGVSETSGSR